MISRDVRLVRIHFRYKLYAAFVQSHFWVGSAPRHRWWDCFRLRLWPRLSNWCHIQSEPADMTWASGFEDLLRISEFFPATLGCRRLKQAPLGTQNHSISMHIIHGHHHNRSTLTSCGKMRKAVGLEASAIVVALAARNLRKVATQARQFCLRHVLTANYMGVKTPRGCNMFTGFQW